jgi:hypothetical protein
MPATMFATSPSVMIGTFQGLTANAINADIAHIYTDTVLPSDVVRDGLFLFEAPV